MTTNVGEKRGAFKHPSSCYLLGVGLVLVGWITPLRARSEEATYHHRTMQPAASTVPAPNDVTRGQPSTTGSATITGEIVEGTCYLKKGEEARGPAHRDCAIRCIKEGRPPFVRDEATGQLSLATFPDSTPEERERWLSQIGNRVRVTGRVQERDGLRLLEVEEFSAEHNHGVAPHGGVIGMSGNRHLELVTTPENEIRVYVLDDFMSPLPVAGVRGTGLVKGRAAGERRTALVPAPSGTFLRAADTTRRTDDVDVTVNLETADGPLTMNLPFPETDTPQASDRPSAHDHQHH